MTANQPSATGTARGPGERGRRCPVFEAFEGAVYGALADVGVLSGNHRDDLLGAAMAFSVYQGSDNTTQGDGARPPASRTARTAVSTAVSPGITGCGPRPLTEVIG